MPTKETDRERIERQISNETGKQMEAQKEAGHFAGAATTLYDNVMKAVRDDRAQRGVSQMAQSMGATTGQLVSEPAAIKERAGDVINPLTVDRLTAGQRAQTLSTLTTQAQQAEDTQGSLREIIQAGANQLTARAQQKVADVQARAYEVQALADQLDRAFRQSQQDFLEYSEERQLDLAESKFNLSRAGSGGIGTGESVGLDLGDSPQFTPAAGVGAREGGWVYSDQGWIPDVEALVTKAVASGDKKQLNTVGNILDMLLQSKDLFKKDEGKDDNPYR